MKIAINTLTINNNMTGIGAYTKELMEASSKLKNHSFVYIVSPKQKIEHSNDNVRFFVVDRFNYQWEQLHMPTELKFWNIAYYHSPLFTCPIVDEFPSIITIHDVIPIVAPQLCSSQFLDFFFAHVNCGVRSAKKIITTSNYSKNEIVSHLKVPSETVEVLYQSIADEFFPRTQNEIHAIKIKYRLPQQYCLYVGMLEKRKGIENLLLSVRKLVSLYPSFHLVLAGRKDNSNYDPESLIEKLEIKNNVTLLGYLPQEDLPIVYSGATMFVFPSLYEGFGRPIIEAMASHVPVATSNTSSLPEVAGDAAVYFNPQDTEDMVNTISELWEDQNLRQKLIEIGRKRASFFTRSKFSERLMEFYSKLQMV